MVVMWKQCLTKVLSESSAYAFSVLIYTLHKFSFLNMFFIILYNYAVKIEELMQL